MREFLDDLFDSAAGVVVAAAVGAVAVYLMVALVLKVTA